MGALLILSGCGRAPKPATTNGCAQHFIGDPSQPPQAQLLFGDGSSTDLHPVSDGDHVPLMRPPQGGQVSYVGLSVANVDACSLQLTGRYRDVTSGEVLGFDGRTIDLVDDGSGWGRPDGKAAHLANVNACPDYGSVDIVDHLVELDVTALDDEGRTATASARVLPSCATQIGAAETLCQCECRANYSLGACGGAADGGIRP